MGGEQVFVVRRADFFGGRWPQGFVPLAPDEAATHTNAWCTAGFFAPRDTAEVEPAWKQVIPYCVLVRDAEAFLIRRRKQGGEGRLHGLYSIGLGGHVGPEDGGPADPRLFVNGLRRELHEELVLPDFPADALQVVGLCNDDSNPVGSVHTGLVFRLDLSHSVDRAAAEKVRVREIHKLDGGFRPLVEIFKVWDDPHRFESWSLLVLEALFNLPRRGEVPTSTPSD